MSGKPTKEKGKLGAGWFPTQYVVVKRLLKLIGVNAYAVYGVLKVFADQAQRAYPSQKTIADLTGLSVSTVKRAIAALVQHKLVSVSKERSKKGEYERSVYTILNVNVQSSNHQSSNTMAHR